jgi:hypothetical protein|tara:strand:- start:4277 stop:4648 length:372 start_codon:yes stop_codon:yes gene_type:complete
MRPPQKFFLILTIVVLGALLGVLFSVDASGAPLVRPGASLPQGYPKQQALYGQFLCVERAPLVAELLKTHQEKLLGVGLLNEEALLEVYVSPGGATFTVILTTATGLACLVGAGHDWVTASDS